jgi:hypothetical protein
MEQAKSTNPPDAAEASSADNRPPLPTLEVLIVRMMQTRRDIQAYDRGEMTLEELHALGVRLG